MLLRFGNIETQKNTNRQKLKTTICNLILIKHVNLLLLQHKQDYYVATCAFFKKRKYLSGEKPHFIECKY